MTEDDHDPLEATVHSIQRRLEEHAERRRAMLSALTANVEPIQSDDLLAVTDKYPRWPLGLSGIDDDPRWGGAQGYTIISASKGSGKSIAALGCGLENAHRGIGVAYLDAENDRGLQQERVIRWYSAGTRHVSEYRDIAGSSFHWLRVRSGHDIRQMCKAAVDIYRHTHQGLLVILDSAHKIARRISDQHGGSDHVALRKLSEWIEMTVQETGGVVRFLVLSELNKQGEAKGREIEHDCTFQLHMERVPSTESMVDLRVEKDRDGPSPVELGHYYRNIDSSRLERSGGMH